MAKDETPEQREKRLAYNRGWNQAHKEDELAKKKANYDSMSEEEKTAYLAANKARRDAKRPPCELCGENPRLFKKARCEDCDRWCRDCGVNPRYADNLQCSECIAEKRRERYANDPADRTARLASNRAGNVALRIQTLAAYGNACSCCCETEPVFLTIDHIDGDGADERRRIGNTSSSYFYRYLRDLGYPQDRYQFCVGIAIALSTSWAYAHIKFRPLESNQRNEPLSEPELAALVLS